MLSVLWLSLSRVMSVFRDTLTTFTVRHKASTSGTCLMDVMTSVRITVMNRVGIPGTPTVRTSVRSGVRSNAKISVSIDDRNGVGIGVRTVVDLASGMQWSFAPSLSSELTPNACQNKHGKYSRTSVRENQNTFF